MNKVNFPGEGGSQNIEAVLSDQQKTQRKK